ncbi:CASP-like protein Ni6 [Telopea speciosissima]|uniref:CASP-like protein Ni6 n=1 Tax=Telopea speciosissima TaxID=54955 RepID=UPI001CC4DE48|nr:CASP-like protein Ni6 [Telopea speciosissima]
MEVERVNKYGNIESDSESMLMIKGSSKLIMANFWLRVLLLASSLSALLLMVNSTQIKLILTLFGDVSVTEKYTGFPALVYIVVALSICFAYSFSTICGTRWILKKERCSSKTLLKFYLTLIVTDVVMVGVVAAATGAAGGIGLYMGLEGNPNEGWICEVFTKFCTNVGVSIIFSLFASVLLAVLVVFSAFSIYRLAHKALNLN